MISKPSNAAHSSTTRFMHSWNQIPPNKLMIETQSSPGILERIQNVYQEYPLPFWVLMTGTFIDRLGTNLIMPFLAIYVVQRFDAKVMQVGLIYAIFAVSSGAGNFLAG